jgi:PAS domain S-box-containing protein
VIYINNITPIFKALPLPSLLLLPDAPHFTIKEVNEDYLKFTGTKEKDLVGKSIFEAFPEYAEEGINNDVSGLRQSLLTVTSTGKPDTMATQMQRVLLNDTSKFETRYVNFENIPVVDDNNKIDLIIHSVIDITEKILHQEMAKTLRERNEFIDTILQNLPIGIAVNKIDDGQATIVNKRFNETYGCSNEDLKDINSFFMKVYPEESYQKEIMERIMADIKSGDPERMSWNGINITTSAGEKKIINAKNIPLPDQNLMISTVVDVTQSARQVAEINRSKANQEALINGTADLIWSVDTNLRIIAANNAYREMMKIATNKIPEEGDTALVIEFGEELNNKWKGYYEKALKGERYTIKEKVYHPEKQQMEYGLISFNPIYNAEGKIFGVACYSKDITEDTQNLLALENTKHALDKIMDSSLDVICAVDANGYFLKVSAAAETIWGYKPSELIGKPLIDFVCPEDREKTLRTASNVMAGNNMAYFENRYIRKDGSLVPIEWTARWDEKDQIRYGVARDATEKKKREASLVESEKKYKYLFENNPLPMFIWDFETLQIIDCNEEALMKYGYTRNEFLQLTIKDIRPVEDIPIIEEEAKTEEVYGNIHKKVWRHKRKNGELMFMEVSGHLLDYHGKRASLVMLNDVTDKEHALQKLKDNEAKLLNAQKIAKLGYWQLGMDGQSLYWSDEVYNIWGVLKKSSFQINYQWFIETIHPKDRKTFAKKQAAAFAGKNELDFEYRIILADGSVKWVHEIGKLEKDEKLNIIFLAGTVQDVTERKKLEIKQKEAIAQQSLFVSIVNSSDDAIMSKTPDGIITSWNRGAETLFGYTKKEAIGKHISLIIPPNLLDEESDIIAKIKRGEHVKQYETERLKKDGSRIKVSLTVSPVLDSNGNITGTSKILRDITERYKAEEAIHLSNERYDMLARATNDCIWDWDIQKNEVIRPGKRLENLLGYDEIESLQVDEFWSTHVYEEDWIRLTQHRKKLLENPEENYWEDEYRLPKPDGQFAYVHDRAYIIRDNEGYYQRKRE